MAALILFLPLTAASSPPTAQQQVLRQEALWLKAVAARDASTLGAILDDGFVHVNYKGQVEGKAAMLARIGSGVSFGERTSDHRVTVVGTVAVVHGVNTVTSGGRVLAQLRYTDVYVLRGSVWKAISAQETLVHD